MRNVVFPWTIAAVALAVFGTASPTHALPDDFDPLAVIEFHDGTFSADDWQQRDLFRWDDAGASYSSWSTRGSGGNPGANGFATNDINIDGDAGGGMWSSVVCQAFEWDPTANGEFEAVCLSVDALRGGWAGASVALTVIQGEYTWFTSYDLSPRDRWQTFSADVAIDDLTHAYSLDGTGQQVPQTLSFSEGAEPIRFGIAFGASNPPGYGSFTAFTYFDNFSVAVMPVQQDQDGDGLPDDWELLGVPYEYADGDIRRYIIDTNGDGVSDADPMRADVFVEVDVMQGVTFPQLSAQLLKDRFAEAPIDNPDGSSGVSLHLVVEPARIPGVTEPRFVENASYDEDSAMPDGFIDWREQFFGMLNERVSHQDNWTTISAARGKVFRYCVVMHKMTLSAGNSESPALYGKAQAIPSNNMIVCTEPIRESFEAGASHFGVPFEWTAEEFMATIFMHELGHALGLGHGGFDNYGSADNINGKPNYFSVMNYFSAFRDVRTREWWRMDFSRGNNISIDEKSVDESCPVARPNWLDCRSGVYVPIGMTNCGDLCGNLPWERIRVTSFVNSGKRADIGAALVDEADPCGWCPDGDAAGGNVVQDVDWFPENSREGQGPYLTVLTALKDWDKRWLKFAPVADGGASGAAFLDPYTELSPEALRRSWDTPFVIPCDADLAPPFGGPVDHADLIAFVEAFKNGNMVDAEWYYDGILDLRDITGYLQEFTKPECQK